MLTNPLVELTISPLDGYGTFGPSSTYHHIIVGADPAEPGPTGPTGPTGPQGIQGPSGVDGVGANGVWRRRDHDPTDELWNNGEFTLLNTGNTVLVDPGPGAPTSGADVSYVLMTLNNCADLSQNHLETSGNTVGAYLVIRGWDETCAWWTYLRNSVEIYDYRSHAGVPSCPRRQLITAISSSSLSIITQATAPSDHQQHTTILLLARILPNQDPQVLQGLQDPKASKGSRGRPPLALRAFGNMRNPFPPPRARAM